jgi:modification methylase
MDIENNNILDKWLNKIHCADCLELMGDLPNESIDLVVTSPPYNIKNSSGGFFKNSPSSRSKGLWVNPDIADGYSNHDDNMVHSEYVEWQRSCLSQIMRLLKPNGAIFYNHKWRIQNGLLQDRSDIVKDFPVRQIIIWSRSGGINFNNNYFLPTYEVIYLIAKPDFRLAPKANGKSDVWNIPQNKGSKHPAPFPVALAQQCISSTNANIILDPFVGSGTTALAAKMLNRDWIGIDNSKKYCDMARNRVENFVELIK